MWCDRSKISDLLTIAPLDDRLPGAGRENRSRQLQSDRRVTRLVRTSMLWYGE